MWNHYWANNSRSNSIVWNNVKSTGCYYFQRSLDRHCYCINTVHVTPTPMLWDMKGVASQKSLATTNPEKSGKVY